MTQSPHFSNLVLASLQVADFAVLQPHLKIIDLPQETILYETGDLIDQIYFPHIGVVSLVVELASGDIIEVAMIGRDSLVGASAILDGTDVVVQSHHSNRRRCVRRSTRIGFATSLQRSNT